MPDERLRGLPGSAEPDLACRDEVAVGLVGKNDDAALLRDREFLPRDGLHGVTEHVRVLEPDVREQDDPRLEDVRRVEAAAEPGLDHRDVDLGIREGGERRGGHDLELGSTELLRSYSNARHRVLEVGFSTSDPDPLAPPDDVR